MPTETPTKPYWKTIERTVDFPVYLPHDPNGDNEPVYQEIKQMVNIKICPKCGKEMIEETNREARTMWHWSCSCGKKY